MHKNVFNYILISLLIITVKVQSHPDSSQYISTTISADAGGYKSLQKAYQDATKCSNLGDACFRLDPIPLNKYHMTLMGYDIFFSQDTIPYQRQQYLTNRIHDGLMEAATQAYKAVDPIALPFEYLGIFKKKIVGIFDSTSNFERFIDYIDHYFKQNIKDLTNKGTINSIKKHQAIIQPHIAVANHQFPTEFGAGLTTNVPVTKFIIDDQKLFVSVQWRTKK